MERKAEIALGPERCSGIHRAGRRGHGPRTKMVTKPQPKQDGFVVPRVAVMDPPEPTIPIFESLNCGLPICFNMLAARSQVRNDQENRSDIGTRSQRPDGEANKGAFERRNCQRRKPALCDTLIVKATVLEHVAGHWAPPPGCFSFHSEPASWAQGCRAPVMGVKDTPDQLTLFLDTGRSLVDGTAAPTDVH